MKTRRGTEDVLSPRLEKVLGQIMDREFAKRLRIIYEAGAEAIEQLSLLNLVRYEGKATMEDGPADLSLWEEMAPAVRDTVIAVNGLLQVIRDQFPAAATPARQDREAPASMDARLAQEVESVLHRTAEILGREISQVRDAVMKPEVVSDRWALLAQLQSVRGDMRRRIGDLVYLTAAAFGEVERAEVVPGHQAEVDAAAELRSTVAELRRALGSRMLKLAGDGGAVTTAKQISEDLEMFARMPAYLILKASAKRQVSQHKAVFTEAAATDVTAQALKDKVEPLLDLLQGFGETITTEMLHSHDREIWVACGLALEQAQLHLQLGSFGARRALHQAVKAAGSLHGMEPNFDAYLRKLRNTRLATIPEAELEKEITVFGEQLAKLPFR